MKTRLYNAYLVTCDETFSVFENGEVCVENGKIVSAGKLNSGFIAENEINCEGDALLPGFVCVSFNPLRHFLNKHYSSDESLNYENSLKLGELTGEDIFDLTYFSALKMQRAGITYLSVGGADETQVAKALLKSESRANVKIEIPSDCEKDVVCDKIEKVKGLESLSFSFSAKPWFLAKQECFSDCAHFAKVNNTFSSTECCATLFEVGECDKQFNMTPISLLEKNGFFDYSSIIENPLYIEKDDLAILKDFDVSVCVDIESTLQNGNGIFPLLRFLNKDINVCLGLSGNNFCFDVFKQLNLLSMVGCGSLSENGVFSDEQLLLLATRNGAKAVGLEDKIGSIKAGAFADIVRVSTKNFVGNKNDILHFLVSSANCCDVVFTMIDGEIKCVDQKMLFAKKFDEICEKTQKTIEKVDNLLN